MLFLNALKIAGLKNNLTNVSGLSVFRHKMQDSFYATLILCNIFFKVVCEA